jgi:hypothetical protein
VRRFSRPKIKVAHYLWTRASPKPAKIWEDRLFRPCQTSPPSKA